MNIVIIKYNAGNIESVNNALTRLGVNAEITADHEKIKNGENPYVYFPPTKRLWEVEPKLNYSKKKYEREIDYTGNVQ